MEISEKIKLFFETNRLSNSEIGEEYGATKQSIGNYINGRREIPIDFLVWLKKKFPEIDYNKLFSEDNSNEIIFNENNPSKELILKEIDSILSKYIK
ncbi:helix-turn-helix domain-containing protein [Chryseobacterium vrystaatense]|uniref:HTH cro/C1-type domain-containing protein n=1 Tax=Chryseobacterium vrystaatense TaxID=307480 RepID=A0ABR4UP50_9FLAO|nr:helix-turn-helix transcriptional regulator [Chryseobacterium vrystaatense]KFF26896.1 hypothetical protein IW16_06365 [Chryseobacterium vrystaatense]